MKPHNGPILAAMMVGALIAMAGCASAPPRPAMVPLAEPGSYGYSERQLAADRYEVRYVTPRLRAPVRAAEDSEEVENARQRAFDLALWRAAQLALDEGYPFFAVTQDNRDVSITVRTEPAFSPFWPYPFYYDRYDRLYPYYPYYPYYRYYPYSAYDGYRSRATVRVTAEVEVEMLKERTENSYDAAETDARLREIYAEATYPGSD